MKSAKNRRAARARALRTQRRRSRIRTSSWSAENKARVTRAEDSLYYYLRGEYDPAAAVCSMLSDLHHYCDAYGVGYREQDEVAYRNYVGQVLELI